MTGKITVRTGYNSGVENEPSGFILPDNPGLTARALLGPLLADAPIGLALVDAGFRYVFINETQAGFNERSVPEHLGKTVREVVGEAFWQQLAPFFQQSLRGDSLRALEVTSPSLRQPGVLRHYLISFYPVRSDRRTVTGVGTVVTDITERKQNEALISGQNRILEGIATDCPLSETLTALASLVEHQLPNIYTMVLLCEKDDGKLWAAASPSLSPESAAHLWASIEAQYETATVPLSSDVTLIPLANTPDKNEFLPDGASLIPAACRITPIHGKNDEKLGAFGVFFAEPREPTARETGFVHTAVHTARIAIERERERTRRRQLLRDMLGSLTENRLILCLSSEDLPAPLPTAELESKELSAEVLSDLRRIVTEAARDLGMSEERCFDLEVAVGEASMNAVVHAGDGVSEIFTDSEAGRLQIWIRDTGAGIAEESLHRATLERGFSTGGTLGHGFWMILNTIDKVYLLTGSDGTTIVLEQGLEAENDLADAVWNRPL